MLLICLITIVFTACMGMIFFHTGTALNILVAGLGIAMIVFRILLNKKLPRILMNVLCSIVAVILIVLLIRTEPGWAGASLMDYRNEVATIEAMIVDGDSKAQHRLEKVESEYGENDTTFGLHAMACMCDGKMEEAWSYIDRYTTQSQDYYIRKEMYYLLDHSREMEYTTQDLYRLYVEAAGKHPEWEYAQRMAGIAQYEQQNYVSAEYYLLSAYELDADIPATTYYLGVLAYRTGKNEECKEYFRESIEDGAGENLQGYMAWYMAAMEENE